MPPASRPAWRALTLGLLHTAVPCQGEPEAWFGDQPADREQAAAACLTCPLIAECRTYARAAKERFGVWAGVDLTPRPRGRRRDA